MKKKSTRKKKAQEKKIDLLEMLIVYGIQYVKYTLVHTLPLIYRNL